MAEKKPKKKLKKNEPEKPAAQPQEVAFEAVASPELMQGKYSNVTLIQHTRNEFVLDFLWILQDQRFLASRVIRSPEHAKRLHAALRGNLEGFEKKYGVISTETEKKE